MDLKDYVTVKPLGTGGFAAVTRLRHRTTGEEIALKSLTKDSLNHEDYRSWFQREIKILKKLNGHNNVIRILHSEVTPERCLLVMPAAKQNLDEYMQYKNQHIDLPHRVGLFKDVLAGMIHAHRHNILHRDLAPQNVLVFEDDSAITLKLADFGLGKRLDSNSVVTSTSDVFGRSYYIAPEVVDSLKASSKASDVFSMGRLLQFVLTGKLPTRKYSGPFGAVITRATADDLKDRYQSAEEFAEDFHRHEGLVFAPSEEALTLLGMAQNEDAPMNWQRFHKLVLDERYDNAYSDYLAPINTVLLRETAMQEYYATVGEDIGNFVSVYRKALKNLGSTGWSYDDAPSFSYVLARVLEVTHDDQTKLQCYSEIWEWAYVMDRWKVQALLDDLLPKVPKSIEHDFAAVIANTSRIHGGNRLIGVNMSAPLRKAVTQVLNKNVTTQ